MGQYKNLVRKANIEYRQIEEYVTEKACGLMKLDIVVYNYAFTRALQKPSMLSKIRGSDESFRRRMWKRITSQTDKVEGINDTLKKKIYMELLTLQNTCEMTCLGLDSWDQGREEMRIDLLSEQTKVGDLLYMKYKIQLPVFEQNISEAKFKADKDVTDFALKLQDEIVKVKKQVDKKFELTDDQKQQLKQVTKKSQDVKKRVGENGKDMGFDDFKAIETSIFKLEERLLTDQRVDQRAQRRALLCTGKDTDVSSKYWDLLQKQAKEENDLLRKISKSIVAHYGVSADVYQGWIEIYLEKQENQKKLMNFRDALRKQALMERPAVSITKE